MPKAELRKIDEAALARITQLNREFGEMLEKIYTSQDGENGYFAKISAFNMKDDLQSYAWTCNLHNENVHDLWIVLKVPDGVGVGNVFYFLRDAVELCHAFSMMKMYCQFTDITPSNQSDSAFFDFSGTFVEAVGKSELDIPSHVAAVVFDGMFFLFHGRFRKSCYRQKTVDFLQSVFTPMNCGTPYSMDELVIHIRSGDIFENLAVYNDDPSYWQPPLIWYQKCILAHKDRHPAISVLLVAVDNQNPCVDAILFWCRENGIEVDWRRGTSMEDYRCLMRAQAFIDSRGTYTEMVRKISPNLKMMYRFEQRLFVGGPYDIVGSWQYTPETTQRLLDAREEDLFLPPDLYEDAFCLDKYRQYLPS